MALSQQQMLVLRVAVLDNLVQMLYAHVLWDKESPTRLIDAYSEIVREQLIEAEKISGLSSESAMAMTELIDGFFQRAKTLILQRAERDKKRG